MGTHGTPRLQAVVDLYTADEEVCDCTGSVCSLIPPADEEGFPCYQGSVEDATTCFKTDPVIKSGTTSVCDTCESAGYPVYLQNDPVYTNMQLWGKESKK